MKEVTIKLPTPSDVTEKAKSLFAKLPRVRIEFASQPKAEKPKPTGKKKASKPTGQRVQKPRPRKTLTVTETSVVKE